MAWLAVASVRVPIAIELWKESVSELPLTFGSIRACAPMAIPFELNGTPGCSSTSALGPMATELAVSAFAFLPTAIALLPGACGFSPAGTVAAAEFMAIKSSAALWSAAYTPEEKSAVEITANFTDFDLPLADANSPTAVQVWVA